MCVWWGGGGHNLFCHLSGGGGGGGGGGGRKKNIIAMASNEDPDETPHLQRLIWALFAYVRFLKATGGSNSCFPLAHLRHLPLFKT